MKRKYVIKQIREALEKLEGLPRDTATGRPDGRPARVFPNASFSRIGSPAEDPLPKREADVDAFIRRRTRIYLQSWVLPYIKDALEELENGQ